MTFGHSNDKYRLNKLQLQQMELQLHPSANWNIADIYIKKWKYCCETQTLTLISKLCTIKQIPHSLHTTLFE